MTRDAVYIEGFKAGYSQARFDLEQEPCDAVSRKNVMSMLHNHAFDNATSTKISALIKAMRGEVERMPSVTPAEKVGHWEWNQFDDGEVVRCSECKEYYTHERRYCPNCGAKMEVQ